MDPVRPADLERLPLLLGSRDNDGERPLQPAEDQRAGVADLQRQRRVDDVGGRQAIVKPPPRVAELLGNGVDESRDVVVRQSLDLRDAFRRRRLGFGGDLGRGLRRDDADLRPSFKRGQLDIEPARELALVRPDPGHGRAGVAGDHCLQSRALSGRR